MRTPSGTRRAFSGPQPQELFAVDLRMDLDDLRPTIPDEPWLSRRSLLTGTAAWSLLTAFHGSLHPAGATVSPPAGASPRLRSLRLRTAASLGELRRFYSEQLGLPLLQESTDRVTFAVGASELSFTPAGAGNGEPFYHFAFNIPHNKIASARVWLLEKTSLILPSPDLRDPALPPEVVWFRHWDAHSLFFWDPAGNLVELIARHTLDNAAPGPFTVQDVLLASEIAFIVPDVPASAAQLAQATGLGAYPPGTPLWAIGDEHGLLLVIVQGRLWGWGSARARPTAVFPTEVALGTPLGTPYTFPGFPYLVS